MTAAIWPGGRCNAIFSRPWVAVTSVLFLVGEGGHSMAPGVWSAVNSILLLGSSLGWWALFSCLHRQSGGRSEGVKSQQRSRGGSTFVFPDYKGNSEIRLLDASSHCRSSARRVAGPEGPVRGKDSAGAHDRSAQAFMQRLIQGARSVCLSNDGPLSIAASP